MATRRDTAASTKKPVARKPAPATTKKAGTSAAPAPVVKCQCSCQPVVLHVPVFQAVQIGAGGNAIGPAAGIDLSGYRDYRLALRVEGPANASFRINELYGPAGNVQQMNADIGEGRTSASGSANYRKTFEVFAPKGLMLRIFNMGSGPMTVNASLYAVK